MKTLFVEFRSHHVLKTVLGPNAVVVDLGANAGEFSQQISAAYGCECCAVEADPRLYAQYQPNPRIQYFNYVIGPAAAQQTLFLAGNTEANSVFRNEFHSGESVEVPGITFEEFAADRQLDWIDLLKIDIEGSEIELFHFVDDETLRHIGQITIEFHDFVINTDYLPDIERIINRLEGLGFVCLVFSRPYNYSDVVFINRAHPDISRAAWAGIYFTKGVYFRLKHYYRLLRQFWAGLQDFDRYPQSRKWTPHAQGSFTDEPG